MKNSESDIPYGKEGLGPAAAYKHDHNIRNVNLEYEHGLTFGQRVSDRVTEIIGGWPFVITQSFLLVLWMVVNVYLMAKIKTDPGFLKAWDPYPFILLNLVLSFQSAYAGPIVMMSQNRQSDRDRLMAQQDFEINRIAEEEIEVMMNHLAHQDKLILSAIDRLEALKSSVPDPAAFQRMDALAQRLEETEQKMANLIERIT